MFHSYGLDRHADDDLSSSEKEGSVWKIINNFSLKDVKSRYLLQFPLYPIQWISESTDCLDHHLINTHSSSATIYSAPFQNNCNFLFYYEVRILDCPTDHPVFGFGLAPPYFEEQGMVGWDKHSIGYHADDGIIYDSHGSGYSQKIFVKFEKGDCVSLLWYNNEVYFAKNGQFCPHSSKRPFNKFMNLWASISTNTEVSSFQVVTEPQYFRYLSRDVFHFLPEKQDRKLCTSSSLTDGHLEDVSVASSSSKVMSASHQTGLSAEVSNLDHEGHMTKEDQNLILQFQQDFTKLISTIKTKNSANSALYQQVQTLKKEKEQLQIANFTLKDSLQKHEKQHNEQIQELEKLKKTLVEEAQHPEKRVQISKDELSLLPLTTLQNMKTQMESNLKHIHDLQLEREPRRRYYAPFVWLRRKRSCSFLSSFVHV
ncbi:hypothetical protein FDP41_002646 [Naegleria fowleri]|uniref:B30.2/SPRY domain-containing protein n=1 Tax=Naegleria fowleri TaxID=5763 RepID=A0A6A5BUP2_NAEFO|nr:uncharacterized protein FDP41_002646 [Naegleria fowleri]KAF0978131.1 hypothetical protein FDP41_002646 [Naegleria fowleri]